MEQPLFNSDQPNESEQNREIRNMFFDTFPLKCELDEDEFYVVPREGTYQLENHFLTLKPGDVVRLVEGKPVISDN